MYGMSGPELLTQLKMHDTLREAERIHRVSAALRERSAARRALFAMNLGRFWHRAAALPSPPANHEAASTS
jgi:hypothetical protein